MYLLPEDGAILNVERIAYMNKSKYERHCFWLLELPEGSCENKYNYRKHCALKK